jgi:uncharacterized membrane-anchored protein YhcB (DUF1043 family)
MSEIGVILIFVVGVLIGGVLGALIMLVRGRRSSECDIERRAVAESQIKFAREQLVAREQQLKNAFEERAKLQANVA